jgi:hypothetical protein
VTDAAPCPFCSLPAGFHDDEVHAVVRSKIPAHLRRPGNKVARKLAYDGGTVNR